MASRYVPPCSYSRPKDHDTGARPSAQCEARDMASRPRHLHHLHARARSKLKLLLPTTQIQLGPPPTRLALRALRGLHRRQRTRAEPRRRRRRWWWLRLPGAGGHEQRQPPGRRRRRAGVPACDAKSKVSAFVLGGARARACVRANTSAWSRLLLVLTAHHLHTRGQYSDATLNELESQNDGQVEGILGKVRILKDVRFSLRSWGAETDAPSWLRQDMRNTDN